MSASPAPRFSIVIPVYKVQGYLRECLDSVLGQSCGDFEIVAVDDRSPDASGTILDEYAARDERVQVVHREENGGIGRARNSGVERARGAYLLFLDGDDTLASGALEAIATRLDETGDPDILLFDHVRTYWWNKVQRSATAELLSEAGAEVFRPAERPEFFDVFAVVWNRTFRRDFYVGHGFSFTDGVYEDALMVYETMLTAERVACLDHICVEYRQRRRGNSMRTPGRGHFAIFPQYQRLFDFLAGRPDLDHLRPLFFGRMVDHFLFTYAREERVLPADRKEYFRRASAMYQVHRPPGFVLPDGIKGAKYQALEKGSYTAFQALKLVNGTRVKSVRTLRRTRNKVGKRAFDTYYRLQRRRPLDENLAVYAAYWHRLPACNPLAVYEKAKEIAPEVHGVWVVRKQVADQVPDGIDHVVIGSPRYWEVLARATYFVNNVNFPDQLVKRPGQIHLQTHHGTPLKRMGIDQQRYPAAAKGMSFRRLLARADRWDFSVSANQHTTENWERVYPCDFESVDAGYPRNDVFLRSTADDVAGIRAGLGIAPGRTAVLYAPTIRDYQAGFIPRLDLEKVAQGLGPDAVLLVRSHYFYGDDPQLQRLSEEGMLIDVSAYPVVEDLCLAADALITDYSSIMFDYAALDRPIVVYADDWDVYVKSRGVTFDLLSGRPGDTPGAVARTEDELVEVFRSGAWRSPEAARLRTAFRERFSPWDDGNAAERVVRRFFLDEPMSPAPVPLAERTPAPAPSDPSVLAAGPEQAPATDDADATEPVRATAEPPAPGLGPLLTE